MKRVLNQECWWSSTTPFLFKFLPCWRSSSNANTCFLHHLLSNVFICLLSTLWITKCLEREKALCILFQSFSFFVSSNFTSFSVSNWSSACSDYQNWDSKVVIRNSLIQKWILFQIGLCTMWVWSDSRHLQSVYEGPPVKRVKSEWSE